MGNHNNNKSHVISIRVSQSLFLSSAANAEALGIPQAEYFRLCIEFYDECVSGENGEGILKQIKRKEMKREHRKQEFLLKDLEEAEYIEKLKEVHLRLQERKVAEKKRGDKKKRQKKFRVFNSHLRIPNLYTHLTDETLSGKPFFGLDGQLGEINSNKKTCVEVINEITTLVECGEAELIPLDENRSQYKLVPNGGVIV